MAERILQVRIKRTNPLRFDEFIITEKPRMSVLLLLDEIREEQDSSVYYESVCRSSVCGSCAMRINGQPKLACKTQTSSLPQIIVLEPLEFFPVIKDLATDKALFFEKLNKRLEAWVHREKEFNPLSEERISDKLISKIYDAERCIECGICVSSCPSQYMKDFTGATGISKGLRFIMDPRNENKLAIERLINILASDSGLWACRGVGACQNFCPKEIPLMKQLARARIDLLKLILK